MLTLFWTTAWYTFGVKNMLIFKIGDLCPYFYLMASFLWCLELLFPSKLCLLETIECYFHVTYFIRSNFPWVSADKGCRGYLIVKTYTLSSVYQGFFISVGHFPYTKYLLEHRELFKKFNDRTSFSFSFFFWRGHSFGGRLEGNFKVVGDAAVTQWQSTSLACKGFGFSPQLWKTKTRKSATVVYYGLSLRR